MYCACGRTTNDPDRFKRQTPGCARCLPLKSNVMRHFPNAQHQTIAMFLTIKRAVPMPEDVHLARFLGHYLAGCKYPIDISSTRTYRRGGAL